MNKDGTTSFAFPNMFDIARNRVAILYKNPSIVNRTRLLLLTEPTELYRSPTFGAGLRRYLWQYNTENTKALVKERITSQIAEFEPCADPEKTTIVDGLVFTGSIDALSPEQDANRLKLTVGMHTLYGYTEVEADGNEQH